MNSIDTWLAFFFFWIMYHHDHHKTSNRCSSETVCPIWLKLGHSGDLDPAQHGAARRASYAARRGAQPKVAKTSQN